MVVKSFLHIVTCDLCHTFLHSESQSRDAFLQTFGKHWGQALLSCFASRKTSLVPEIRNQKCEQLDVDCAIGSRHGTLVLPRSIADNEQNPQDVGEKLPKSTSDPGIVPLPSASRPWAARRSRPGRYGSSFGTTNYSSLNRTSSCRVLQVRSFLSRVLQVLAESFRSLNMNIRQL